jgi:hypothetical protein
MDSDKPRPMAPYISLFNVNIRLFLGFIRNMRESGMAVVASSSAGVGRRGLVVVGGKLGRRSCR